jgi:hypothetical protein
LPADLAQMILLFLAEFDDVSGLVSDFKELSRVNRQFNQLVHPLQVDFVSSECTPEFSQKLVHMFPRAKGLHLDVLDETVVLPNLQRLRINSVGNGFAENIVRFPITELRIDCLGGRSEEEYVGEDLWTLKPQLETLHIRFRDFSWPLGNFAFLAELCLVECNNFTDECFRGLSGLQRLYLRHMDITDAAFQHMPNLVNLHFEGCQNIGDGAIQCLSKLRVLKMRNISSNSQLSDEAFVNSKELEELHIPRVYDQDHYQFTEELFKYLPNLKRLFLVNSSLLGGVWQPLELLELSDPFHEAGEVLGNLRVKELVFEKENYDFLTPADLHFLVLNGLEELSFIMDKWADSRFSPVVQIKKTFTLKNMKDFFPWVETKDAAKEAQCKEEAARVARWEAEIAAQQLAREVEEAARNAEALAIQEAKHAAQQAASAARRAAQMARAEEVRAAREARR